MPSLPVMVSTTNSGPEKRARRLKYRLLALSPLSVLKLKNRTSFGAIPPKSAAVSPNASGVLPSRMIVML